MLIVELIFCFVIHRKFHTHVLEFDGQGGWNFEALENNAQRNSGTTVENIIKIEN